MNKPARQSFVDIQERMVTEYLRDHPQTSEKEAYIRTKDAAWEEAARVLSEQVDSLNKKLDSAIKKVSSRGDNILNVAIKIKSDRDHVKKG